jgi:hypothetical protein
VKEPMKSSGWDIQDSTHTGDVWNALSTERLEKAEQWHLPWVVGGGPMVRLQDNKFVAVCQQLCTREPVAWYTSVSTSIY